MSATETPFRYYMRVRYGDCDGQKVVYNPKYGEYIDLACTEYLRVALHPRDAFDGSFEFQVVKLLIEWKGPALFDDVLEISVQPTRFGTTSFTLAFEMRRSSDGALLVTGETVNVHAHRVSDAWAKLPLADDMRRRLQTGAIGRTINHAGELPRRD